MKSNEVLFGVNEEMIEYKLILKSKCLDLVHNM